MRAVQARKFGGPEVLVPRQAPDPVPGPGQAVVAVAVADVLFLETQLRSGWGVEFFDLTPPFVLGGGVAGRVLAVAAGVDPGWIGRRVVTMTDHGGYAEQVAVPAEALIPVPSGLALREAAALLQIGPAALSLVDAAGIKPGERVLVTAAGGGLGSLLIQVARAAGAEVIAAAGGKRKLDLARELGAGTVIDYSEPGWADQVREATGGAGVDVVFDGAGGQLGDAAFGVTARGGRFFAYGIPGGSFAQIEAGEAERREVTVRGIEQVQFEPAELRRLAGRALAAAVAGEFRPVIGQTFALERAADAHRAIAGRDVLGKTLLLVEPTARAVRHSRHGGPEVLTLAEVPMPEPGPGQVRVAVHAAGVNAIDWKIRSGLFGGELKEPAGVGIEFAGTVDAVGPGVQSPRAGSEVFGRVGVGAAATHVLVSAEDLLAKPDWLSYEEAAALPVAAETAYRTLRRLDVGAGQILLIHAVAGGVGLIAAQLAQAWGATVVGTAGAAHHPFLRELGVRPVTYGDGWADRVRAAVPESIDAVLDASGRGVLAASVELTGSPDRVVTIADARAGEHGVRFSTGADEVPPAEVFAEILPLAERGAVRMPIERTFPLGRIADAHRLSEGGHLRGKIVLTVP